MRISAHDEVGGDVLSSQQGGSLSIRRVTYNVALQGRKGKIQVEKLVKQGAGWKAFPEFSQHLVRVFGHSEVSGVLVKSPKSVAGTNRTSKNGKH